MKSKSKVKSTYCQWPCSPRRWGCPGQAPQATGAETLISSCAQQVLCLSLNSPFRGIKYLEDLLQWFHFHSQSQSELYQFTSFLGQVSDEKLQDI